MREKCLKEAVSKSFCPGTHTLTYGTAPEQREEKVQELKELEEELKSSHQEANTSHQIKDEEVLKPTENYESK